MYSLIDFQFDAHKTALYTRDPFGFFAENLGATAGPALIAALLAGLTKLFMRSSKFLNIWLIMFVILASVFTCSRYVVAEYESSVSSQ